ncbi:hypothetical protein IFR05_001162 [Cadophora sp. M221]|nr:hypothetical protein IFR05_001162 [Cadophora sp. M221]
MSAHDNNQNWANQMVDGGELPAFSGLMDPGVGFEGAGAGTRFLPNERLYGPVDYFPETRQLIDPGPLAFQVPGLVPDYSVDAPDNVLGSSSNDGSASTHEGQLNQPWDLGVAHPLVMGMDMGMDMSFGLDQFSTSPYLPAHGTPDLAITYGFQGFQPMDMFGMTYQEPSGLTNTTPLPYQDTSPFQPNPLSSRQSPPPTHPHLHFLSIHSQANPSAPSPAVSQSSVATPIASVTKLGSTASTVSCISAKSTAVARAMVTGIRARISLWSICGRNMGIWGS